MTTRFVATVKEPKLHPDGGNLYLQVQILDSGHIGKSWIFRFNNGGRDRWMGLGPLVDVGLARARELAADCRDMVRQGLDPIEERRQTRFQTRLASTRAITFKECSEAYIAAHAPSWRNEKHRGQWENTLATYADPVMGKLQVRDVDTDHVLKVLEPIWTEKHETARRLRARLERILSWATTRKYREGDNPARWVGHLKDLLAKKSAAAPVKHHPALPYDDLTAFVVELRQQAGTAARALELTILTASRTKEIIGATWQEFDLGRKEWVIPGERMKSGLTHRVPLSVTAVELLKALPRIVGNDHVFPGMKPGTSLSNMAMLTLLQRRMNRKGVTVHGFRSSFRDWAAESTAYANHVVEMALAHTINDKVEAAYRRGDLMEKRARLMQDWAKFIEKPVKGKVTPIRSAK